MKPKIGAYIRVSTANKKTGADGQTEYRQTHKSQTHAITAWAKTQHIPPRELRWYADRRSGKSLQGRDALARLLKDVKDGRIDTVVVYDLSRLARNLIEGLKTLADLSAKVRVVSVSENIDFGNSTGQLIASILLAVAQFQRELTVEKIKAGLAARKAQGLPLGRPRDADKLRKIRALRDKGMSVNDIAEKLGCTRQNVYNSLDKTKDQAA